MKATLKKTLGAGVVSQALGVLTIPLLMVFYSVEELAQYGVFFSLAAVSSVFVSLRLENALYVFKNDLIFRFSAFCLLLIHVVAIAVALVCYFGFEGGGEGVPYSLGVVAGGAIASYNVAYNLAVRASDTKGHVYAKVARAALEVIAVLACLLLGLSVFVLMVLVALSYYAVAFFLMLRHHGRLRLDVLSALIALRTSWSLFVFDFVASISNTALLYCPVLYFHFQSDAELAGVYFALMRVCGVPAMMIAQAVGVALKQHAVAEREKTGSYFTSFGYVWDRVIKRSAPLLLVVIFATIVGGYLAETYSSDGYFYVSVILAPLIAARFVFNCISPIVYVAGLQRWNALMQLVSLVCVLVIPVFLDGGLAVVLVYSLVMFFFYCFYVAFLVRFAGGKEC